jgi:hypothetical protein
MEREVKSTAAVVFFIAGIIFFSHSCVSVKTKPFTAISVKNTRILGYKDYFNRGPRRSKFYSMKLVNYTRYPVIGRAILRYTERGTTRYTMNAPFVLLPYGDHYIQNMVNDYKERKCSAEIKWYFLKGEHYKTLKLPGKKIDGKLVKTLGKVTAYVGKYRFSPGAVKIKDDFTIRNSRQFGVINRKFKWIEEPRFFGMKKLKKKYPGVPSSTGPVIDKNIVPKKAYDEDGWKKWGMVNKRNGEMVVPAKYKKVGPHFVNGYLRVERKGKYGFVDKKGKEVVPCIYDNAGPVFHENKTWFIKNGKQGFVNNRGTVVIPAKYTPYAAVFKNDAVVVKSGRRFSVVDGTGKVVMKVPGGYKPAGAYSEGMLPVEKGGRFGYANSSGVVIPAVFSDAGEFSNGLAVVVLEYKKKSKRKKVPVSSYINKKGELLVKPTLLQLYPFSKHGYAPVYYKRKFY